VAPDPLWLPPTTHIVPPPPPTDSHPDDRTPVLYPTGPHHRNQPAARVSPRSRPGAEQAAPWDEARAPSSLTSPARSRAETDGHHRQAGVCTRPAWLSRKPPARSVRRRRAHTCGRPALADAIADRWQGRSRPAVAL